MFHTFYNLINLEANRFYRQICINKNTDNLFSTIFQIFMTICQLLLMENKYLEINYDGINNYFILAHNAWHSWFVGIIFFHVSCFFIKNSNILILKMSKVDKRIYIIIQIYLYAFMSYILIAISIFNIM